MTDLEKDADALLASIRAMADPTSLEHLPRSVLVDKIEKLAALAEMLLKTNVAAGQALATIRDQKRQSVRDHLLASAPPQGSA